MVRSLILITLISFLISFLLLPIWIRRVKTRGFVGKDMHKIEKKEVAEMGGIVVVFSMIAAILVYVALETFYYSNNDSVPFLLAAVASILIAAIIGMVDDMLGWKIGLRQREKVILTFLIPVPLMVVNAGISSMSIPFLGGIDIGLIYPLIIVPIAIIGAANGFNMLAGYNGLEAGMGIIILSVLGFISLKVGETAAVIIALSSISALIAFLLFNRYPSKVFPGDTLTYPVGATIAIVAILGNIEKFAAIIFVLYYIELLLKIRGRFKKESFAKVLKDGSLAVEDKCYTIPHLIILAFNKLKFKTYEYRIVVTVLLFQTIISIITLYSFYSDR